MRDKPALTVLTVSVYTTTSASRTPSWAARMKSTMCARNATDLSLSTTVTAISSIARPTMITSVWLVNVDSSSLIRESAKLWILAAFDTKEDNALTVFLTSDSKAVNVRSKDVWISRTSSATDALPSMI